uniref:SPOR domain-containing protein n=1 Tax=uncultured bacterium ws633F6 TaxID=1131832 RepID=I1X4Z4_9BACT|nr:hypothetical protein ws633F6_0011 [uncultured bacterium ws633F6]
MSGHSTEEGAIAYINQAGLSGEIGYYQTQYKNQPWFAVTYGNFSSLDDARGQLGSLPENLQNHAPWPRSFKAIKSLIDVVSVVAEEQPVKMGPRQEAAVVDDVPLDASWEEGQAAYDRGDETVKASKEAELDSSLVAAAEESLMAEKLNEEKLSHSQELAPAVRQINSDERARLSKAQAAFTRSNYMKAHNIWLPLAESGIAEAQYSLGFVYQSGWGPERDLLQAVAWYTSAAEQNEARAQFNLGILLLNGEDNVEKDTETGILWLTRSADAGNTRAKEFLIDAYKNGKYGIEKSADKAEYWKSR